MNEVFLALARFVATFAVGVSVVAMGFTAIFRFVPCWTGGRCVNEWPAPGRLTSKKGM